MVHQKIVQFKQEVKHIHITPIQQNKLIQLQMEAMEEQKVIHFLQIQLRKISHNSISIYHMIMKNMIVLVINTIQITGLAQLIVLEIIQLLQITNIT